MSATQPMGSVRKRPIPGMTSQALPPESAPPADQPEPMAVPAAADRRRAKTAPAERRAADYGATRLVNFRLPVDLHDRFRALVREAEERHPRLRKASLTELLIALLEEGPQSADEVAELIRRKRLAEHEER